jgi:pimeloyl-ACP methyl ester carboxylesterase
MWGDTDRLIDVSRVKILEEKIANHRTVVMKDCGHIPPLERPEEAADHYRRFISER